MSNVLKILRKYKKLIKILIILLVLIIVGLIVFKSLFYSNSQKSIYKRNVLALKKLALVR